MRTIYLWLAAIAVVLAMIASPLASARPTRGYSCNYRSVGVTIALDGYMNSRSTCRAFNNSFGGVPTYGHPGRAYCAWRMRIGDIRTRVFSTSPAKGSLFCAIFAGKISTSDWQRIK